MADTLFTGYIIDEYGDDITIKIDGDYIQIGDNNDVVMTAPKNAKKIAEAIILCAEKHALDTGGEE